MFLHAVVKSRRERLTGDIAALLLSLQDAEPDFDLINLPAVRWKLLNLEKLKEENPGKQAVQWGVLEDLFH